MFEAMGPGLAGGPECDVGATEPVGPASEIGVDAAASEDEFHGTSSNSIPRFRVAIVPMLHDRLTETFWAQLVDSPWAMPLLFSFIALWWRPLQYEQGYRVQLERPPWCQYRTVEVRRISFMPALPDACSFPGF
jgi:hypothetical protein